MMPPQPPQAGNDLKLDGLTRDEIKKIEKSMKRPEFMGLLNEYMVEISDPKNKAEYDQYLKQMEREGQLPKHMKLVKLKPQFCLRTFIVSSRNKAHEMKFFINMCSSQYIEKPSCQTGRDENGGTGYNWRVPNSLGKIRYDQDKHKSPCQVVDCAFHPDTFHFASHPSFQSMIISIALEGAERQLGQRKETLSKDYVILKNLKCKAENGEPALLPIRYIEGKTYNRGEGPTEQQRNQQGKQTKLQKQIGKQKEEFEEQKKKKQKQAEQEQKNIQQELDENPKLIQDMQSGIQAPKFTSIYTYKTDYSQFIDGPIQKKSRQLPNIFTVEFKVPRMESIAEATTLDISDKKIIFAVQDKYYIDISFEDMRVKGYPLKCTQAKAKFDKKKKSLRIQIPVDLDSIQEQSISYESQPVQNNQDSKVIENQTWKTKVLQIAQPEETNKFLPQQSSEPRRQQKRLVEQIDEDDVIQEVQPQSHDQIEEQEVEQTQQAESLTKFSVSQYYPYTPVDHQASQVQSINYITKQTNRSIVVMVYLKNYKPEDISAAINRDKHQFLLLHRNFNGHRGVLHIEVGVGKKISNMEVINRVGYCALVVGKAEQGQWNNPVQKVGVENESFTTYQSLLKDIVKSNEAAMEAQRQSQQVSQDSPQIEIKQVQNGAVIKKAQKSEQIDDSTLPEPLQLKIGGNQENAIFQKLPLQFIRFNTTFVDVLN